MRKLLKGEIIQGRILIKETRYYLEIVIGIGVTKLTKKKKSDLALEKLEPIKPS
jgi:hypothetical protein